MLAFALEAHLPEPLEDLTCAFLKTGSKYLGVAVRNSLCKPMLDALSDAGVGVERMTLDVLFAAENLHDQAALLWCDSRHLALFTLERGCAVDLRVLRSAIESATINGNEELASMTSRFEIDPQKATVITGPIVDSSLSTANERPSRTSSALREFNLAIEGLEPQLIRTSSLRSWQRCAACVMAGLMAVSGALWFRHTRIEQQLKMITDWERRVFARVFPNVSPPPSVALRLASERKTLEAISSPGEGNALRRDAIETLREVINAMPGDLRVNVEEIRIDQENIITRARTPDHAAGNQFGRVIAAIKGVDHAEPRTQRDSDGTVRVFVQARYARDTPVRTDARGQR
jgi:type II secretory pathway component PulL